jgi:hypothetical protein
MAGFTQNAASRRLHHAFKGRLNNGSLTSENPWSFCPDLACLDDISVYRGTPEKPC